MSHIELIEESFLSRGIDESEYPEVDEELDDITWCTDDPSQGLKSVVLDDVFISGTGYFGNEAGQGCVYSHAAIVIEIPSFDDRAALLQARTHQLSSILGSEVFAQCLQGDEEAQEKENSSKRLEKYNDSHPWIVKGELLDMAQVYGVSTSGSADQIANRIGRRVERERRNMYRDEYGDEYGEECGDEDEDEDEDGEHPCRTS